MRKLTLEEMILASGGGKSSCSSGKGGGKGHGGKGGGKGSNKGKGCRC